jgi:hypothetical protein
MQTCEDMEGCMGWWSCVRTILFEIFFYKIAIISGYKLTLNLPSLFSPPDYHILQHLNMITISILIAL